MSIFEPWTGQRVSPFNPEFASSLVGNIQAKNRRKHFDEAHTQARSETASTVKAKKPARPGKFKAIQLSEEPQMEQATSVTTPTTPKLPVKSTRAYPKKIKGTAPGTKPKKK
jgi:hypothetical protein